MQGEHGTTRPRPRVLITGAGEPRVDDLCAALGRRAIDAIVIEGSLDEAIRVERPNLVLLVGEAASDDGARAIEDARRAGSTPIVVATDPEPLDRRLAPFAFGASGVLVRRDDPNEMAGELQHLIAENARRIAESADERAPEELHGLLGMSAREIRSRGTPLEVPRYEPIERPSIPGEPVDEVPTLEISVVPGSHGAPLPDWDDLTTKRQPAPDVARWRRLSAADRGAMATPPARVALDSAGTPRTPAPVSGDLDLLAEMAAETRPAIVSPPHERPRASESARPPRAARVSSVPPPGGTEEAMLPATVSDVAVLPATVPDVAVLPATVPEAAALAPPVSEPISTRPLVASTSSRPPIADRASTLRAQATPRPRASSAPALIGLAIVIVAVVAIAVPRAIEAARETSGGRASEVSEGSAVAAVAAPAPAPAPAPAAAPAPAPPPPPAAAPEASAVAAIDAASVDALVREARGLARRGAREQARAMLEQAVALDPNDPHAAIALASQHLADRRAEDAVLFAERAVSLRRRRPDYHVVLGDAYRLAGDDARARASWERALELDPEHPAARDRLAP